MVAVDEFRDVLSRPAADAGSELEALLRFAREAHGADVLEDDFSILRLTI